MLQHLSGFKGNHGRIWHRHWQGQGQAVVASFSQRSTGGCYPKMLYLLFCLFQCFTLEFVIKIYFTIPGKLLIFTIPGNFLGTNPSQLHLGVPAAPGAANCIGGPCKVARDEWSAADGSCWQWMASGIGVKADQKDHTCHGLGHWLRGGKNAAWVDWHHGWLMVNLSHMVSSNISVLQLGCHFHIFTQYAGWHFLIKEPRNINPGSDGILLDKGYCN